MIGGVLDKLQQLMANLILRLNKDYKLLQGISGERKIGLSKSACAALGRFAGGP